MCTTYEERKKERKKGRKKERKNEDGAMDALYMCASTAFYRISICLYMYVVIVIFCAAL